MIYPVCMQHTTSLTSLPPPGRCGCSFGVVGEVRGNANGWRLFVPEMGTPCQHGAAVDLWEGRQERERREGGGGEEWGRGCRRVHERGMYTGHATGGKRGRTAYV